MRFPAVVLPGVLVLAGAVYFFARAKENPGLWPNGVRQGQSAPALAEDQLADDSDRELVRSLLETRDLTEDQASSLLGAAGRRYMRRKLAYAKAKQAVDAGKAAPATLDLLRQDMESARKVCDLDESLGPRAREIIAQADSEMERRLAFIPSTMVGLAERFDGVGTFTETDLGQMEQAFQTRFGRPMPISTRGDSAVHRAMGFDHRGRFDLAVNPYQPEGVWARRYLTDKHVTFFAFRSAVPGKATGAHIHIGPASTHRAPNS
jgi:hypothetical protein